MSAFTRKRRANRVVLDGLRRSGNPIAFFCECDRDDCYQAAWLTCADYERSMRRPRWRALSDAHWEEPARGVAGARGAMSDRSRWELVSA
jgi:hypothetical protein